LIRVFGEPRNRTPKGDEPDGSIPPTADRTADLIAQLEAALAIERERGRKLEERAERYETELGDLRGRYDEVVTRLLQPPETARPGFWARLFR
jgi:hypothetical protein